jgi:hypothetical protein
MDATNFASNGITVEFVKASATKTLVLLNSGIEKTFPDGKRKLSFLAEMDGTQKDYTPNSTTLQRLIAVYGKETTAWIGKKLTLSVGLVNGRESVLGNPQ